MGSDRWQRSGGEDGARLSTNRERSRRENADSVRVDRRLDVRRLVNMGDGTKSLRRGPREGEFRVTRGRAAREALTLSLATMFVGP